MRILRALGWLTLGLLRRSLREGTILRSLVAPGAIASLGTLAVIGVLTYFTAPAILAVTGEPDEALRQVAERYEVTLVPAPDAERALRDGLAPAALDGANLWVDLRGVPPLRAESVARRHLRTSWRPWVPPSSSERQDFNPFFNVVMVKLIAGLFCLYGVVFGAGAIARDRTEGLLDSYLALPVPFWVVGLSRWLSATTLLGVIWIGTVALIAGSLYLPDPIQIGVHGLLGMAASAAIGVLVVGKASLDRSFSGPLSSGLLAVGGVLSIGILRIPGQHQLPIASLVNAGPDRSVIPAFLGLVALVLVALWRFQRVTAVDA